MSMQTCPHCEHQTNDMFEVLDNNIIYEMTACERCGKPFYFAMIECDHCGHEQTIANATQLTLSALRARACPACKRTYALADHGNAELL
jgi:hypothetical protein